MLPTAGGLLSYFYSESQERVYEASATILVQHRGSGFAAGASDFRRSGELASTYRSLVTAKPFLEKAKGNAALSSLSGGMGSVFAIVGDSPPVLIVSSRDSDPEVAAITAQVVAEEFIDYAIERRLAEIARLQSAAAAQGITVQDDFVGAQLATVDSLSLLESVSIPGSPVLPRTRQNTLLGTLLGLILAAGGALLLDSLRDTVRSPDQLTRRFGAVGLGLVFKWSTREVPEGSLVLRDSPTSSYAEAIRQIRSNIQFATVNHPTKTLLFSSPGPGEGKSTILSNLALSLVQTGKRVIIVDGDLRRPSIHTFFDNGRREPGLSNLLADLSTDLVDVVSNEQDGGIDVIYSGPTPPNPAELLGAPSMNVLLSRLKEVYDTILIDSPPLLIVADAAVLASQVDAVVVVVDGRGTRSSSLQAALDTLRTTQVDILGVIINKLKRERFGYGYPSYYYQYYAADKYYGDLDKPSQNGAAKAFGQVIQPAKWVWSRIRSDETSQNGAPKAYRRVTQPAKWVWSKIRKD